MYFAWCVKNKKVMASFVIHYSTEAQKIDLFVLYYKKVGKNHVKACEIN